MIGLMSMVLSNAHADQSEWSEHTAYTLPQGRWEIGLFGPVRYGLKDDLEIEIHPVWAFLSPHVAIKKGLASRGAWQIGIRQSLAYPTLLLNTLARGGIGGILPPDVNIPHIVSSDTRFLLSNALTDRFSITLRAQLNISSRFGESDFPHIPVPVVYPRTASYQGLATLGGGLFARYGLGDVEIRSDTQIWYMVGNDANWSAEQWLSVRWFALEGFSVDGGVVGTVGVYPYGQNWHLIPTLDMTWSVP